MLLAATLTVACTASPALPDLQFSVELTPAVPVVGERAEVRVTAGGAGTAALAGASLDLEGHMTHPGMTPVVARLEPDGRETGRMRRGVSAEPQFPILSLIAADYEVPKIKEKRLPQHMYVDWVRVWETGTEVPQG